MTSSFDDHGFAVLAELLAAGACSISCSGCRTCRMAWRGRMHAIPGAGEPRVGSR